MTDHKATHISSLEIEHLESGDVLGGIVSLLGEEPEAVEVVLGADDRVAAVLDLEDLGHVGAPHLEVEAAQDDRVGCLDLELLSGRVHAAPQVEADGIGVKVGRRQVLPRKRLLRREHVHLHHRVEFPVTVAEARSKF